MDEDTGEPADYAELYSRYITMIVRLVRRAGIRDQDALDVAHEIIIKFMSADGLSWYDPDKLFAVGAGVYRRARFHRMLRSFVSKCVLAERDRQITREAREAPIGTAAGMGTDAFTGWEWEQEYASWQSVCAQGKHRADLVALLDDMRDQVIDAGRLDYAELAAKHGIGYSTVRRSVRVIAQRISTTEGVS